MKWNKTAIQSDYLFSSSPIMEDVQGDTTQEQFLAVQMHTHTVDVFIYSISTVYSKDTLIAE